MSTHRWRKLALEQAVERDKQALRQALVRAERAMAARLNPVQLIRARPTRALLVAGLLGLWLGWRT